jgi:purine-binding chemotaxis protein CheW
MSHLVGFTLDGHLYALYLACVERIVRVVEVTPLPKAPEIVLGVVSVQGKIVPILDVRKRFSLREREIDLSDHMVVAHTARRRVALVVDSVTGIVDRSPEEIMEAEKIAPGTEYLKGVAKLDDGLVLIHDLDRFLSLDEENRLEDVLTKTYEG